MATKEEVQAEREKTETLRQVLAAETTAQETYAKGHENDITVARLQREQADLLAQIEQARGTNQAAGIEPTPEFEAAAAGEPLPTDEPADEPPADEPPADLPPPPAPDVLGNVNDGVTPPTDPEPGDVPPELPHRS